jgi:hypothetical protein
VVEQSLADHAKSRADLLRSAATTQLRVVRLEQELKQVREAATTRKEEARR